MTEKPRSFQEIILRLQNYWAAKGCAILQPYDMEVGAGTFHPTTLLKALGPEPWNVAYVQPSRRPTDGRYGDNPNRLQHYYQYQVLLKPSPYDVQKLYLQSMKVLGVDPLDHDIRFVEDDVLEGRQPQRVQVAADPALAEEGKSPDAGVTVFGDAVQTGADGEVRGVAVEVQRQGEIQVPAGAGIVQLTPATLVAVVAQGEDEIVLLRCAAVRVETETTVDKISVTLAQGGAFRNPARPASPGTANELVSWRAVSPPLLLNACLPFFCR